MKIKNFKEYIKEDVSSEYDIEKPFSGDGDDLTTQEIEGGEEETLLDDEIETEVIYILSQLEDDTLEAIASGKIDIANIAKTLLNHDENIDGIEIDVKKDNLGDDHKNDNGENFEY